MYQPTRRPLLAGMRRTAATIALAVIASIGALGVTAPAHASSHQAVGIQRHHMAIPSAGCSTILETRVVSVINYVGGMPVNVVDQTQQRYKTSCLGFEATYTAWVVVSSAPHHP